MSTIFIANKYTKWYNNIILKASNRSKPNVYTEKHHIIPKSLGGDNLPSNLVSLTAREHFICHWLLTKMLPDELRYKATSALWYMTNTRKDQYRSRIYSIARIAHAHEISKRLTGITRSQETREKISISKKGLPVSLETRRNMSIARKGMKLKTVSPLKGKKNPEHSAKLKGRIVPESERRKISAALKGKPWSVAKRASQIEVSKRIKGRAPSPAQLAAWKANSKDTKGKPKRKWSDE